MDNIRVALVDDHEVFRDSMKALLEREPDLSVVAVAGDAFSAVEMVGKHKPDILLIDYRLPKMSGVEATRVITSKYPTTKVIVLTLFADDGHRSEALEAGAHACLSKDGHFQGILNVIRDCYNSPDRNCFEPLISFQSADEKSVREHLLGIIKSIVQYPNEVAASELNGSPPAFRVFVSALDFHVVISRLDEIRTIASSYAGLPEEKRILIQLLPV